MKRIIFLHGVGSNGANMQPVADMLSAQHANLTMHCPDGPEAFAGGGNGRQWFSVAGVTEENRPQRVADALAQFRTQLERFGSLKESLLVGFSQGAIMSLHGAAAGWDIGGVVAISGRLANPIASQQNWPPILQLHGDSDPVMPLDIAKQTNQWLSAAGAAPKLLVYPGVGHQIHPSMLKAISTLIREIDA